ncbi:Hypothetical protein DEACI_0969 [Acididesulfobacillus acetoxydans]|uniref:Uncharacterized protein n=1 Tax=Acididesulfobacillus acetoxydans TaxID=1561005 RepID=A0A8S0XAS5_9FIRM|nr:hypothetical protein [Acididesulfobacillus acetoxydans]CAA7600316.1 Hypothetical protein DEACI_0969 [Acididesulfobacillus acetoxydans]CEJ06092.1 Hypothetical protein DEACI_0538 [Acididesulfobacillus acetoxydans]
MEWALAIPQGINLKRLDDPWAESALTPVAHVRAVMEKVLGPVRFSRLYFGQEFCEKALPAAGELEEVLAAAHAAGLAFTLVTPYVTETALARSEELLERLVRLAPRAEVVVNDWGLLYLLSRKFPTLVPVLGRLMNKILRDPRLSGYRLGKGEVSTPFQMSYLAGPAMQTLLEEFKVRRIELDYPPQGLDPHLPDWGYRSSLYVPLAVITTGRICLMNAWGMEKEEKFKTSRQACDRKCRFYWLEMSDPSGQVRKSRDWRIVQKGNTVFYLQREDFLAKGLEEAARTGVNRIVFQPEPI